LAQQASSTCFVIENRGRKIPPHKPCP
jgi:hypothetical protein